MGIKGKLLFEIEKCPQKLGNLKDSYGKQASPAVRVREAIRCGHIQHYLGKNLLFLAMMVTMHKVISGWTLEKS